MIIAIDFDGTIVEHKYPEIGYEIPFATATIKKIIEEQHQVILWTVRKGELLEEAVNWCKERGIEFYAVNKNFPEEVVDNDKGYCKINADVFIDDRNLGGIPDWGSIYKMISEGQKWSDIYSSCDEEKPRKKKGWFW